VQSALFPDRLGPLTRAGTPRRARAAEAVPWVRMMVSFTANQHHWLRATAFEQRTTATVVLRGRIDEVAQLGDIRIATDARFLGALTASEQTSNGGPRGGWHRMTALLTRQQHEWLRRQAFAMDTSIAQVVRGCVALALPAPTAAGTAGAASPSPRRTDRRRRQSRPDRTYMRVGLPADVHTWLRREAFDQGTTAAELVRRYVNAVHRQVETTEPATLLNLP
jgi:hypothetical protein